MTDKNRSEVPADLIGEGETYTKHVQPTEAPEDLISVDEDYVASQIDPRNVMLYTGLVNALGQPVVHAGIKKLAEKTGNAPKTYDDALVRYAKAMFGENALVKKDQSAIQRANQRALGNPELREGSARLKPIRLGGGVAETSDRCGAKMRRDGPGRQSCPRTSSCSVLQQRPQNSDVRNPAGSRRDWARHRIADIQTGDPRFSGRSRPHR